MIMSFHPLKYEDHFSLHMRYFPSKMESTVSSENIKSKKLQVTISTLLQLLQNNRNSNKFM